MGHKKRGEILCLKLYIPPPLKGSLDKTIGECLHLITLFVYKCYAR